MRRSGGSHGDLRMSMERWRPFGTVDGFFGRPVTVAAGERMWVPLAGMRETKEDLILGFDLPGVGDKEVSATFRDRVLEIRLPKMDEVKPKEIKIEIV